MDSLVIASMIALLFRVTSITIFILVLVQQFFQLRYKPLYDGEDRLKKLLLAFVFFVILSQLPISLLHLDRIIHAGLGNAVLTSIATVFNAAALLVVSVLLYLIYKSK